MTMLNNFFYYKTDSHIHALNPILKFLLVILFIIATFMATSMISHIFLIAFLLIIMIATNIPFTKYIKVLLMTSWILILVFLIDFLIFKSIMQTLIILVSFISIIFMIYILFATTKTVDLMMLFEFLLSPLKLFGISPRKVVFKIMSNMAYMNIMYEENKVLRKALKNHNSEAKVSFKNSSFSRTDYLEQLVFRTRKRLDLYNNCMEVKNYDVENASIYRLYVRRIDYAFVSVQILLLIAIIVKG